MPSLGPMTWHDVIYIGLLIGSGMIFLYDRFAVLKRHDEVIEKFEKTIDALTSQMTLLSLAIERLGAEFHTYKDMARREGR